MGRFGTAVQAAVVAGLAIVPGAAFGQTTTTTTSTTLGSTTTTVPATTPPAPTSTTVPNPCAGRRCAPEPPGAVLSTSSTELVPDRGSFCWLQPGGTTTVCLANAVAPGYRPPVMVVTHGQVVTVRFTASVSLVPDEVALVVGGARTALPASNPTQFRVDLAPGVHQSVSLATRWLQGEVSFFFGLDVRPAAATPSTGRTLALTG